MLDKIINKQVAFYSMFNNFNNIIKLDIKKDIKQINKVNNYNLTKKDINHIIYNIIITLCKNYSLEWNNKNDVYIFYPVDHLKTFINNYYFIPKHKVLYFNIKDLINLYKECCHITSLNNNDRFYLMDNFNYQEFTDDIPF